MGGRPTEVICFEPLGAPRSRVGSCRGLHEIADPDQVVDCRGEREQPDDPPDVAELDLAAVAHRLQPAEDLFDPFAFLLTHGVAGMTGGARWFPRFCTSILSR